MNFWKINVAGLRSSLVLDKELCDQIVVKFILCITCQVSLLISITIIVHSVVVEVILALIDVLRVVIQVLKVFHVLSQLILFFHDILVFVQPVLVNGHVVVLCLDAEFCPHAVFIGAIKDELEFLSLFLRRLGQ